MILHEDIVENESPYIILTRTRIVEPDLFTLKSKFINIY